MPMKFATRQNLGLNRPPAIWFIRRFLDPQAEILLFPPDSVVAEAGKAGAVPFHTPGVELHVNKELQRTTLDAFLAKYEWAGRDAALDAVAAIVRDASYKVPTNEAVHMEAYGLRTLHQGFRITHPDDRDRIRMMSLVFDALYEGCRARIEKERAGS